MTKDFITAALPFLFIGIGLAIMFASLYANRKKRKNTKRSRENYGVLGMLIGMSIGSALGCVFEHFSTGMTTGMLFGMAIGMCFDKSNNYDDEDKNIDENSNN